MLEETSLPVLKIRCVCIQTLIPDTLEASCKRATSIIEILEMNFKKYYNEHNVLYALASTRGSCPLIFHFFSSRIMHFFTFTSFVCPLFLSFFTFYLPASIFLYLYLCAKIFLCVLALQKYVFFLMYLFSSYKFTLLFPSRFA